METLEQKLKLLPEKPGVYIMKDHGGNVIYVGKSKCLKNRVRQYFTNKSSHTPKVLSMVEAVCDFEYIITDTEWEALVLECNLIKKYRPHYNILLKDSGSYPYIRLSTSEEYPRIFFARTIEKNGDKYFGPYTSGIVKDTLEILRKTFKVRTCDRKLPQEIGKGRPCLNHHINLCVAPCGGKVTKEEYQEIINEIIDFLEGRESALIEKLTRQMNQYAEELKFEAAAAIRDKLNHLKRISDKQKVMNTGGGDKDIIAVVMGTRIANAQVFSIREGKMLGREELWLEGVSYEEINQVVQNFITQFYIRSEYVPKEINLNILPEDAETVETWLSEKRGSKVEIRVPKRGTGRELMDMAVRNGQKAVNDYHVSAASDASRNILAAAELAKSLGIKKTLNRIESYDISTTAGENSVGSMAVMENGEFARSEYRHFKIKTVSGVDDYASLNEVLTRRFQRWKNEDETGKFAKLPDLILADGGVAQARVIQNAVEKAGADVPVFGMVKDVHHKTRGIVSPDGEVMLDISNEAFRLAAAIQEEVHRIAIGYHRKLRSKAMVHSALEDIEGVGPKRRASLMKHFKSIQAIKNATVEELSKAEGVSRTAAEKVFEYFHGTEKKC